VSGRLAAEVGLGPERLHGGGHGASGTEGEDTTPSTYSSFTLPPTVTAQQSNDVSAMKCWGGVGFDF